MTFYGYHFCLRAENIYNLLTFNIENNQMSIAFDSQSSLYGNCVLSFSLSWQQLWLLTYKSSRGNFNAGSPPLARLDLILAQQRALGSIKDLRIDSLSKQARVISCLYYRIPVFKLLMVDKKYTQHIFLLSLSSSLFLSLFLSLLLCLCFSSFSVLYYNKIFMKYMYLH